MAQVNILLCGADEALHSAVSHHLKDEPGWTLLTEPTATVSLLLVTPQTLNEVNIRRCPAVLLAERYDAQTLEQAVRLGVDGLVRVPDELRNLRAVISRALGSGSGAGANAQRGDVLALCSMKGGSGTSLIAANLAIELQHQGHRTLLADLHPGVGSAHTLLNLQPRRSWAHLLMVAGELQPRFVESVAAKVEPPGLTVLPSPGAVQAQQQSQAQQQGQAQQQDQAQQQGQAQHQGQPTPDPPAADNLRALIAGLRQHYRFVVLDCPTGMSPITLAALQEATQVFYVMTPDALSIPPTWAFKAALDSLPDPIGRTVQVLINRHSRISELQPEALAEVFGIGLAGHITADYEHIQWHTNRGKPAVTNGSGAFVRDIRRLAGKIAPAQSEGKGGEPLAEPGAWINRLFRAGTKGAPAGSGGR